MIRSDGSQLRSYPSPPLLWSSQLAGFIGMDTLSAPAGSNVDIFNSSTVSLLSSVWYVKALDAVSVIFFRCSSVLSEAHSRWLGLTSDLESDFGPTFFARRSVCPAGYAD